MVMNFSKATKVKAGTSQPQQRVAEIQLTMNNFLSFEFLSLDTYNGFHLNMKHKCRLMFTAL